jgi:hypothetical protein
MIGPIASSATHSLVRESRTPGQSYARAATVSDVSEIGRLRVTHLVTDGSAGRRNARSERVSDRASVAQCAGPLFHECCFHARSASAGGCREVKLVELKLLGERGLDLYATGPGVQGEA